MERYAAVIYFYGMFEEVVDIKTTNTPKFNFRPMGIDDLVFFLEIRNDCCDFLEDNTRYHVDESREWFLREEPKFFMIENEGEIIGYFRTSNWNEEKHSVWVGADLHKAHRGKGLAKLAYDQFLKLLMKKGYNIFYLSVLSHNRVAHCLYKKLGFETISIEEKVKFREGKHIDRINMVLTKKVKA
jgi:RimJ/RimL family protein N-acetyltransferase